MYASFDAQNELYHRQMGMAAGSHIDSVESGGEITIPVAGVCGQQKLVSVCLANTDDQRSSACSLINKMYSWRGYGSSHKLPVRSTHSTFTTSVDGDTIGTLTLAVDSAAGLAADGIFQEEIDQFRSQPGAKVCELTKLAFSSTMPSKPMLAALFHIVFIYGQRCYECTDLFIEVHPRHRRFYEMMLGFKRVGTVKTNVSVDAPAQLMWLKVSDIRDQIDEHAGQGDAASVRSLYPFFFLAQEEDGLFAQIKDANFDVERAPSQMPSGILTADRTEDVLRRAITLQ
jgi:hypothetical protein